MQIDYNIGDNDEQFRERDVSDGSRAASAMKKEKDGHEIAMRNAK